MTTYIAVRRSYGFEGPNQFLHSISIHSTKDLFYDEVFIMSCKLHVINLFYITSTKFANRKERMTTYIAVRPCNGFEVQNQRNEDTREKGKQRQRCDKT